MAHDIQIAVDCARPHDLADWWAQTLGWTVEAQDESFIRSMVEAGHASEADTTTHRGALVWRVGAAIVSPDAGRPRILFQAVPEAKAGKNRLHLDVRIGEDDRETVVGRLIERGARELWRASQGPLSWVTLADPEGNEFCVT
jgi:Glyoxalase-like domain